MNFFLVLSFLNLLSGTIPVQACFTPKPDQISTPEDLIARTSEIHLAKAQRSVESGLVEFEVIETLKGKNVPKFHLRGHLQLGQSGSDFNRHRLDDFWMGSGGRASIGSDCQLTVSFTKEGTYLIFVNRPFHFKSFELIESPDDLWLLRVRKELSANISGPMFTLKNLKSLKTKFKECSKTGAKGCYKDVFDLPLAVIWDNRISVADSKPFCRIKKPNFLANLDEVTACFKDPELRGIVADCLDIPKPEPENRNFLQHNGGVCLVKFKDGRWLIYDVYGAD